MSFSEVTANLGFRLIDFATDPYHEDEWFNWRLLDGILEDLQVNTPFAVATGAANAYAVNYTPDQTPLVVGQFLSFKTNAANTGACTLAVDGGAAVPIKINGTDPVASAFASGMYVKVVYDGTNFNVVYPSFTVQSGQRVGTSSGATPVTAADDFVVENNDHAGMSVLTPNNKISRYYMGSVSKPDGGGLVYDDATSRLYLRANQDDGPYLDADKVLRQPDRPYVYATKTYAGAASPASGTTIVFDTEKFDNGGFYNNATGEFTAIIAGVYEFVVTFNIDATAQQDHTWGFYKNGVLEDAAVQSSTSNSCSLMCPVRNIISLSAGDIVVFKLVTNAGVAALTGVATLTVRLVN